MLHLFYNRGLYVYVDECFFSFPLCISFRGLCRVRHVDLTHVRLVASPPTRLCDCSPVRVPIVQTRSHVNFRPSGWQAYSAFRCSCMMGSLCRRPKVV